MDELRFLAYCVESYKAAKGLTGRQVYELFRRTGAWDYLRTAAGALHTTGTSYTVDEIDRYIAAHPATA